MEQKNELIYKTDSGKNPEKDRLPKRRRWRQVDDEDLYLENKLESNDSNNCEFAPQSLHEESKNSSGNSEFRFKLASYNLLAPHLLNMNYELYKNINPYYLEWQNRKHKLFYQLQDFDADIYCFQEMQEDQFYEFFEPKLKRIGYKCFFKKRYGREKLDGCCICFKSKKFSLIEKEAVDFFTPQVQILNRENVGLILLLRTKRKNQANNESNNEILCVATTHILYNPKRGDCKLAQMQKFMAHLDRMAYKEIIVNNKNRVEFVYHPTILCGDFNFVNTSKLCEFVSSGKLENYKQLQINLMSGQFETRRISATIGNTLLPSYLGISDQSQFKEEIIKRLNHARQLETNSSFLLRYDQTQSSFSDQSNSFLEDKYDLNNYCTFGGSHLSHPFDFKSVYTYQSEENKSEATTCIENDVKAVDYIFYHSKSQTKIQIVTEQLLNEEFSSTADSASAFNSKLISYEHNISSLIQNLSKLKLTARLELFTAEHLDGLTLPTKYYPSDHFMLAAKFRLI